MHILYKITYLPHINTIYPKYYIGSKYNYKGNYYGSVASTQVFEYTLGMELRKWWKIQNKDNFKFEIIEQFDEITPTELVNLEYKLHIELNVLGKEYFNKSIATKGWVSVKNTEQTKKKKSDKTKAYWDSPEGKLKKERLSERNRVTKSEEMKIKWENPTPAMINAYRPGKPKGSKDLKKRKQKIVRKIYADGLIFDNAIDASHYFNEHVVSIRRKCKLNWHGWRYLDESSINY
jgi:hypothetical protein